MDLNDMTMFAYVAREGSFSKAAKKLSLSSSALSKSVRRLEDALGTRLIQRTTRRLSLTEAGASYYVHCARIVEEMAAAELSVSRLSSEPTGLLRVTAPVTFGALHLVPVLEKLRARQPKLQVDAQLDNEHRDLIQGGFDVAIRVTPSLPDSSLTARRLAPDRWLCAASPTYYERHGKPRVPDDLRSHECLIYSPRGNKWWFNGPSGEHAVEVTGPLTSNNGIVLLRAALSGMGIVMLPEFTLGHLVEAGELCAVLAESAVGAGSIYAIYSEAHHVAPKIRVFVDLLVEHFRDNRWRTDPGFLEGKVRRARR